MKGVYILIVILIIAGALAFVLLSKKAPLKEETNNIIMKNKKVVMIIAFRNFRDEEYFVTKEVLEGIDAEVKTASTELGTAVGSQGGETKVDLLLSDINVADFDAVLFIGGPGAYSYIDNSTAHKIAQETIAENKLLGAICIAPAILAKSGVLNGKKATVWSSATDKSEVKILEDNGAVYQDSPVVADGNIITANGPEAAQKFGEAIAGFLGTDY